MVMYAGQIMEERAADALFEAPQHPYTAALLAALPERSEGGRLATIPGVVPGLYDRPRGCLFSPALRLRDGAFAQRAAGAAPVGRRRRSAATTRSATRTARRRSATIARSARRPPNERARRRRRKPEAHLRGAPRPVPRARPAAGGRRRLLRRRAGAHPGRGRRIRLRQVHPGAHGDADREADRGRAHDRRHRRRRSAAGGGKAPAPHRADRLPEPLWLAQSAQEGRRHPRGAAHHQHGALPVRSAARAPGR